MASAGKVDSRSELARTGATAQKFGTHPAMLRVSPAAEAAISTGLATASPTRTIRCDARAQVSAFQSRNAGCLARAKQRQPSAPAASPVTPCGKRNSDGTIAMSICPSATSSKVGSRGAVHSTATPGASRPSRVINSVNSASMKSGAARRNTRREDLGSNTCCGDSTRWMPESMGRACSIRSSASAVGCIRAPPLISKGSANCSRSRDSEWLTADWVRPSRVAARVTLRSVIKTSNTTRRLRSKWRKSIWFMMSRDYSLDRLSICVHIGGLTTG